MLIKTLCLISIFTKQIIHNTWNNLQTLHKNIDIQIQEVPNPTYITNTCLVIIISVCSVNILFHKVNDAQNVKNLANNSLNTGVN